MTSSSHSLRIAAVEPFYGGSHRAFLDGYQRRSRHHIDIYGLPARKWKWRMRGAAIQFAEQLADRLADYDVLFASDFLSLADFVGLLPGPAGRIPKVVYFHENQLTYPCRDESERDYQFAFTNITTCLAADRVWFNSEYHRQEFLKALGPFLRRMPDCRPRGVVEAIDAKSDVLYFGLDLEPFERGDPPPRQDPPLVLWNHRWEYDKNPEDFFRVLFALADEGAAFRVAVAGERFRCYPEIFDEAKQRLGDRVAHFGYLESRAEYARLLRQCDVSVSTAIHEFFGVSVLEAIAAGCYPLLPNRLTYPELLPPEHHERHLFNTVNQLRRKLRDALAHPDRVRRVDLRAVAKRFSWDALVDQYDRAMERAAQDAQRRR